MIEQRLNSSTPPKERAKQEKAQSPERFFPDDPRLFSERVHEQVRALIQTLRNSPPEHRTAMLAGLIADRLRDTGEKNFGTPKNTGTPKNKSGEEIDLHSAESYPFLVACCDPWVINQLHEVPRVAAEKLIAELDTRSPSWSYYMISRVFPLWALREQPGEISSILVHPSALSPLFYVAALRSSDTRSNHLQQEPYDLRKPDEHPVMRMIRTAQTLFDISDVSALQKRPIIERIEHDTVDDAELRKALTQLWHANLIPYWVALRRTQEETAAPLSKEARTSAERTLGSNPHDYHPEAKVAQGIVASQDALQRRLLSTSIRELLRTHGSGEHLDAKLLRILLPHATCERMLNNAGNWLRSQQQSELSSQKLRELSHLLVSSLNQDVGGAVIEKLFGETFWSRTPIVQICFILFTSYLQNGSTLKGAAAAIEQIEQKLVPLLIEIPEKHELVRKKVEGTPEINIGAALDHWPTAQKHAQQVLITQNPEDGLCSTENTELNTRLDATIRYIEVLFQTSQTQLRSISEQEWGEFRDYAFYLEAIAVIAVGVVTGVTAFSLMSSFPERLSDVTESTQLYFILGTVFLGFLSAAANQFKHFAFRKKITHSKLKLKRILQAADQAELHTRAKEVHDLVAEKGANDTEEIGFAYKLIPLVVVLMLLIMQAFDYSSGINSMEVNAVRAAGEVVESIKSYVALEKQTAENRPLIARLETTAPAESVEADGAQRESESDTNPTFYTYAPPGAMPLFWSRELCNFSSVDLRIECEDDLPATSLPVRTLSSSGKLQAEIAQLVASGSVVRLNLSENNFQYELPQGYTPAEILAISPKDLHAEWSLSDGVLISGKADSIAVVYQPSTGVLLTDTQGAYARPIDVRALWPQSWDAPELTEVKKIRDWAQLQHTQGIPVAEVLTGIRAQLMGLGFGYTIADFSPPLTTQEDVFASFFEKDANGAFVHTGFQCSQTSFLIQQIAQSAGYMDLYLMTGFSQDLDSPWGGKGEDAHAVIGYFSETDAGTTLQFFESTLPETQTEQEPFDLLEAESQVKHTTNTALIALISAVAAGLAAWGVQKVKPRLVERAERQQKTKPKKVHLAQRKTSPLTELPRPRSVEKKLEKIQEEEQARREKRERMLRLTKLLSERSQRAVLHGLMCCTGIGSTKQFSGRLPDGFYSFSYRGQDEAGLEKHGGFLPATPENARIVAAEVLQLQTETFLSAPTQHRSAEVQGYLGVLTQVNSIVSKRPLFFSASFEQRAEPLQQKLVLLGKALAEHDPALAELFTGLAEL